MPTTLNDLRSLYLNFFARNGHQIVSSSPLVPHNDPTLLFTNAGMVQFKNVFTGVEQRPYNRAVTAQKCVRAGGKHNDLDNVGYTARHHTFFEMMGNFSFGDYFKEQAIALGWEFVTKELGLAKDKLLVTVYHDDEEAFGHWRKIGLPESRIIRIATSDNFWSMGDSGPCGPCSEIFFDHGEHIPGGPPGSPDEDGDRFIEIWNLVFMQYDQIAPGNRVPLPRPSIDTGMGLERVAAVLQGVHDNYDTDLFQALIRASVDASGRKAEGEAAVSHRVIADHLRSSSFLMADGVMPSNEGRGYVLRRIMRRAMRHAHHLGCREPLMYKLVPALVAQMGKAYPELNRAEALITDVLRVEEERFKATLDRGLKLLEDEITSLSDTKTLSGEAAFKLYDTYGFPLDLTADILRGRNLNVDQEGFAAAMAKQKAEARKAWAGSGAKATDTVWYDIKQQHGATEFLGYSLHQAEAVVTAIVNKDGQPVTEAKAGETIQFTTNQTPFYGESGGQMGDHGAARSGEQTFITITDTMKPVADLHVHLGNIAKGTLKVGDTVLLSVDEERRTQLRANHSATHLLHKVLRQVLGDHVAQKGSLVNADKARFDFNHPKALTAEEAIRAEDEVNRLIRQNTVVNTKLMTPDQAIEAGALALFGEKYGDEVRVVSMGIDGDNHFSVELCGGTHVYETGDIGLFRITGESSVAAGIRRIEFMTAAEALRYGRAQETILQELSYSLKTAPAELKPRIDALMEEKRKLEREISDLRKAAATGGGTTANDAPEQVNGVAFIGKVLANVPAKDLRGIVDDLKKQVKSGVVAVISDFEGKAGIVVGVTADLTDRINAVDLARVATIQLGGAGGGGRPDMAQSGGPDASKATDAMAAIRQHLAG